MKSIILLPTVIVLILAFSACHKPCTPRIYNNTPTKRVIINASGVEVQLKGLRVRYEITIDRDTVPIDTIKTFSYTIANGDSIVSIEACNYLGCGRFSGDMNCINIVGDFGFSTQGATDGELIFANRKVQTYKNADLLSTSIFNSYPYSRRRQISPPLNIYTYTITPEDYENAKPINP